MHSVALCINNAVCPFRPNCDEAPHLHCERSLYLWKIMRFTRNPPTATYLEILRRKPHTPIWVMSRSVIRPLQSVTAPYEDAANRWRWGSSPVLFKRTGRLRQTAQSNVFCDKDGMYHTPTASSLNYTLFLKLKRLCKPYCGFVYYYSSTI